MTDNKTKWKWRQGIERIRVMSEDESAEEHKYLKESKKVAKNVRTRQFVTR